MHLKFPFQNTYSMELHERISDLTLHSMSGSASHCLIGICNILLSVVSRSYKHSVSGSELLLKRQAEAKMLSFEQPFISLCHQANASEFTTEYLHKDVFRGRKWLGFRPL